MNPNTYLGIGVVGLATIQAATYAATVGGATSLTTIPAQIGTVVAVFAALAYAVAKE